MTYFSFLFIFYRDTGLIAHNKALLLVETEKFPAYTDLFIMDSY